MIVYLDAILKKVAVELKANNLQFPHKDKRILLSISNQIDQGQFLTENQAKLILKIFKENIPAIKIIEPTVESSIEANSWSQIFRLIQKIRKIYPSTEGENAVCIEFTYDKRLKEKLISLGPLVEGQISAIGARTYGIAYTEKNVHTLVEHFLREDFDIDDKILNFYYEIDKLLTNDNNKFDIFKTENEKFKKIIESRVGPISEENVLKLNDQKIRYQYQIFEKFTATTLTEKIAARKNTKIFIDEGTVPLADVMQSLKDLNRFPVLCIFEGHTPQVNKKTLDFLYSTLASHNLTSNVGIYFRFDKSEDTANFNSSVADYQFNKNLNDQTMIAGIANNKLPKFFLKSSWKPKTVISFTNSFKNNKSAVYCADVDLIIYHTDKVLLAGEIDVIV
jgi:hypothetical protein